MHIRLLVAFFFLVGLNGCQSALAEPGGGAAGYHRRIMAAIDGIGQEIPTIIASAEAAAERFVNEDQPIAAAGDGPFVSEALGRSGGLMSLVALPADDPDWRGIVLYALDERRLDEQLAHVAQLRERGCQVVVFARRSEVENAEAAGTPTDSWIHNHAGDAQAIPADGIADIAAMWTWTAEFVAACTRLGKMPTMYLGYVNPGGRERGARIGSAKFHVEAPPAVQAGVLGPQYLSILKQNLRRLADEEMADIRQTAKRARQARDGGGTLYLVSLGHAICELLAAEPTPGGFVPLDAAETLNSAPKAGDLVLVVGYAFFPDDPAWNNLLQHLRDTEATVVWSMSPYLPAEAAKVPPEDTLIDQFWSAGDADVTVPGYDIKVIPTSGVMAKAVYWMVVAETGEENE